MTTVAVVRGGMPDSHAISLKTGGAVLTALSEKYRPLDIFVDRSGVWHMRGLPIAPERALAQADVVFNALHGKYGEGAVQRFFEGAGVSYTGAKTFGAATALNKVLSKEMVSREGIRTARHSVLAVSPDLERDAIEAFRKFSPPLIIKPVYGSFSEDVRAVSTFEDFWAAIMAVFSHSKEVLVEEYIAGREAVAGVIDEFRDREAYPLMPIEVRLQGEKIFSTEAKAEPERYLLPARSFDNDTTVEIERLALKVHHALGLRHYSQSEFIVSPRGIYFVEANSLPELRPESIFAASLAAAGASMSEFTEHIVRLAAPSLHV